MTSDRPTKWWDYLLASSPELKSAGLDPVTRVAYCGHARAMAPRWAKTIGLWGYTNPAVIMERADSTREAYDLFKHRHQLMSRKTWIEKNRFDGGEMTFSACGQVIVATYAHNRMRVARLEKPSLSLGAMAQVLAGRPTLDSPRREPLGVMPVELLLYYWAVELVLEQAGITAKEWHGSVERDEDWIAKRAFWETYNGPQLVVLPEEAAEKYAGDDGEAT